MIRGCRMVKQSQKPVVMELELMPSPDGVSVSMQSIVELSTRIARVTNADVYLVDKELSPPLKDYRMGNRIISIAVGTHWGIIGREQTLKIIEEIRMSNPIVVRINCL